MLVTLRLRGAVASGTEGTPPPTDTTLASSAIPPAALAALTRAAPSRSSPRWADWAAGSGRVRLGSRRPPATSTPCSEPSSDRPSPTSDRAARHRGSARNRRFRSPSPPPPRSRRATCVCSARASRGGRGEGPRSSPTEAVLSGRAFMSRLLLLTTSQGAVGYRLAGAPLPTVEVRSAAEDAGKAGGTARPITGSSRSTPVLQRAAAARLASAPRSSCRCLRACSPVRSVTVGNGSWNYVRPAMGYEITFGDERTARMKRHTAHTGRSDTGHQRRHRRDLAHRGTGRGCAWPAQGAAVFWVRVGREKIPSLVIRLEGELAPPPPPFGAFCSTPAARWRSSSGPFFLRRHPATSSNSAPAPVTTRSGSPLLAPGAPTCLRSIVAGPGRSEARVAKGDSVRRRGGHLGWSPRRRRSSIGLLSIKQRLRARQLRPAQAGGTSRVVRQPAGHHADPMAGAGSTAPSPPGSPRRPR